MVAARSYNGNIFHTAKAPEGLFFRAVPGNRNTLQWSVPSKTTPESPLVETCLNTHVIFVPKWLFLLEKESPLYWENKNAHGRFRDFGGASDELLGVPGLQFGLLLSMYVSHVRERPAVSTRKEGGVWGGGADAAGRGFLLISSLLWRATERTDVNCCGGFSLSSTLLMPFFPLPPALMLLISFSRRFWLWLWLF